MAAFGRKPAVEEVTMPHGIRRRHAASVRGRVHRRTALWRVSCLAAWCACSCGSRGQGTDLVKAWIEKGPPQTSVSVRLIGPFKARLDLNPGQAGADTVVLRVELARRGRGYWPPEFVIVTDAAGRPVPVRRPALEWHRMWLEVPARRAAYYPQAVPPPGGAFRPPAFRDRERSVRDPVSGIEAAVCTWYDGRRAALSIRFDDSHPTHLTTVIPTLRHYGFKGTFMINPGVPDYLEHKAEWEAVARRGDMEFANHTMHHRGARNDEEMEHEIGDAARYIRSLFPDKSRLIALNLGGGTWWTTTRSLHYYLDKYHLFDASSGSLGMDDTYGRRVEAFRQHLQRNLDRRGWCRIHFHSIGPGQSTSAENFRAILDAARTRRSNLWIAGLADAYKYLRERRASKLEIEQAGPDAFRLKLTCLTDPALYDQPLTLQLTCPADRPETKVRVKDAAGNPVALRRSTVDRKTVIRFDVRPVTTRYTIERIR